MKLKHINKFFFIVSFTVLVYLLTNAVCFRHFCFALRYFLFCFKFCFAPFLLSPFLHTSFERRFSAEQTTSLRGQDAKQAWVARRNFSFWAQDGRKDMGKGQCHPFITSALVACSVAESCRVLPTCPGQNSGWVWLYS